MYIKESNENKASIFSRIVAPVKSAVNYVTNYFTSTPKESNTSRYVTPNIDLNRSKFQSRLITEESHSNAFEHTAKFPNIRDMEFKSEHDNISRINNLPIEYEKNLTSRNIKLSDNFYYTKNPQYIDPKRKQAEDYVRSIEYVIENQNKYTTNEIILAKRIVEDENMKKVLKFGIERISLSVLRTNFEPGLIIHQNRTGNLNKSSNTLNLSTNESILNNSNLNNVTLIRIDEPPLTKNRNKLSQPAHKYKRTFNEHLQTLSKQSQEEEKKLCDIAFHSKCSDCAKMKYEMDQLKARIKKDGIAKKLQKTKNLNEDTPCTINNNLSHFTQLNSQSISTIKDKKEDDNDSSQNINFFPSSNKKRATENKNIESVIPEDIENENIKSVQKLSATNFYSNLVNTKVESLEVNFIKPVKLEMVVNVESVEITKQNKINFESVRNDPFNSKEKENDFKEENDFFSESKAEKESFKKSEIFLKKNMGESQKKLEFNPEDKEDLKKTIFTAGETQNNSNSFKCIFGKTNDHENNIIQPKSNHEILENPVPIPNEINVALEVNNSANNQQIIPDTSVDKSRAYMSEKPKGSVFNDFHTERDKTTQPITTIYPELSRADPKKANSLTDDSSNPFNKLSSNNSALNLFSNKPNALLQSDNKSESANQSPKSNFTTMTFGPRKLDNHLSSFENSQSTTNRFEFPKIHRSNNQLPTVNEEGKMSVEKVTPMQMEVSPLKLNHSSRFQSNFNPVFNANSFAQTQQNSLHSIPHFNPNNNMNNFSQIKPVMNSFQTNNKQGGNLFNPNLFENRENQSTFNRSNNTGNRDMSSNPFMASNRQSDNSRNSGNSELGLFTEYAPPQRKYQR